MISRTNRTFAALAVVALFATVGCRGDDDATTVPTPAPDTPTVERTISVLHFNIAGALEDYNAGQHGVVEMLADVIGSSRPDVVSLNEICADQNEHLSDELAELGYVGNFARNNTNPLCGRFPTPSLAMGVAVYVADGALPGSGADYAVGQSTACVTGTGTQPIRACSTHLSSGPKAAARELVDLREQVVPSADGGPLVIAGDFNLDPWLGGMDAMYEDFYEVDEHGDYCRTPVDAVPAGSTNRPGGCTWPNADPHRKLDYVFVDRQHFGPEVDGEVRVAGTCERFVDLPGQPTRDCSDHRQLWGTAPLLADPAGGEVGSEPTSTTTALPVEPFELPWRLDQEGLHCGVGAEPLECMQPAWNGSLAADETGVVSGTGTLTAVIEWYDCVNNDEFYLGGSGVAEQQVTVTGAATRSPSHPGGPRLDVTLTFGPASVTLTRDDCRDGTSRYWLAPFRSFVTGRPPLSVQVSGWDASGQHAMVRVDLPGGAGLKYDFIVLP